MGALLTLGANLLQVHRLLQHLLCLLTLSLCHDPALRVSNLPEPFIRELYSTLSFEYSRCCFIRPRTAHQRRQVTQSGGDVVPLDLRQTALCRAKEQATSLATQPLERH